MSGVDEAVNIVAFTRNVCISITVSVTQWLTVVLSCYELIQTKEQALKKVLVTVADLEI